MTSLFRRDVLEATRMDGDKPQDEFYRAPALAFAHRLDKSDGNERSLPMNSLQPRSPSPHHVRIHHDFRAGSVEAST